MLKPRPTYKAGGLGFGVNRGEIAINLPIAFLLPPPRIYQVVYVPYYFIMLLAMIQPVRLAMRIHRVIRLRQTSALSIVGAR